MPVPRLHSLTLISRVAVAVDLLGARVKGAGVSVLVVASRTAGAHAGTTRDANPNARVSIVTIQASVIKQCKKQEFSLLHNYVFALALIIVPLNVNDGWTQTCTVATEKQQHFFLNISAWKLAI